MDCNVKEAILSEKDIKEIDNKLETYLEIIFKVENFFKKVSLNEIKISDN